MANRKEMCSGDDERCLCPACRAAREARLAVGVAGGHRLGCDGWRKRAGGAGGAGGARLVIDFTAARCDCKPRSHAMVAPEEDALSLTDFMRDTRACLERMRESGRPITLTVRGKAELVVQDARSYQRLLALVDQAGTVIGIHRGLTSAVRGEGREAAAFSEAKRESGESKRGRGKAAKTSSRRKKTR